MANELTLQRKETSLLEMRHDSQKYPRLYTLPEDEAKRQMVEIVTMAFLYKGISIDMVQVQFIASNLIDELLDDTTAGTKYLTMAEIKYVIKRAVLGGEEMFGVSVASLYKVLMTYVKGEGHRIQEESDKLSKAQMVTDTARLDAMIQNYSEKLLLKK